MNTRSTDETNDSTANSSNEAAKKYVPFTTRIFSVLTTRSMAGLLMFYLGILFIASYYLKIGSALNYAETLREYFPFLIGGILVFNGVLIITTEIRKRQNRREERFVDVDARARPESQTLPYIRLIEKIGALEESSKSNIQEIIARFRSEQINQTRTDSEGFVQYFESISRALEQKSAIADEKASILLDKGSNYSRFGIVFFIVAIVAWQLLAYLVGFQLQHIYGIVSCSVLFIFIEFLSAWYLKQYRQFIDTSTYLIKVKSIFDKYMLVYWATRESTLLGFDQKKSAQNLIEMLRADIKWPETYLTKNPDLNFAKEALETMTLFAKTMRAETKYMTTKPLTSQSDKS